MTNANPVPQPRHYFGDINPSLFVIEVNSWSIYRLASGMFIARHCGHNGLEDLVFTAYSSATHDYDLEPQRYILIANNDPFSALDRDYLLEVITYLEEKND